MKTSASQKLLKEAYEKYDVAKNAAKAEATAWLEERYPDYKSLTAYWED